MWRISVPLKKGLFWRPSRCAGYWTVHCNPIFICCFVGSSLNLSFFLHLKTYYKKKGVKSTFGVPVCFRILQSAVMRRKTTKKEIFFSLPLREIATRLFAVQACRFTFLFVCRSTPWDSSDRGIGHAELRWWRGASLLCLGCKWEGGRRQDTFQLGNKHHTHTEDGRGEEKHLTS